MTATDSPAPQVQPTPTITPKWRRPTLIVLWVLFALWVAALLTMYFTTVYPQRHPKDGRPAAVEPAAR